MLFPQPRQGALGGTLGAPALEAWASRLVKTGGKGATWVFPRKIRALGPFLGVHMIRIIVYLGSILGSPIDGNSHF